MKNKLLWVGDAAVPSGFARATHEILERVLPHYDVTVLGINYRGDPHEYPYPIYLAAVEYDAFGMNRIAWLAEKVRPDVIVIQQDGWHIPGYLRRLRHRQPNGEYTYPELASIPVVASLAVDGKNFRSEWLDGVSLAVFWTKFAEHEARIAGYPSDSVVIPLGVDLETFYPVDRSEAFARLDRLSPGFGQLEEKFIVGNVNRNQPRKRWDLTLRYFAEWVRSRQVDDAELFLHVAPTGDSGPDVDQMARYYGITNRMAVREPPAFYGIDDSVMRDTYNCFDVQITTTQGEGFGLTTFEGMACGVPQIVPDWSALGELCKGAACLVPCTSVGINPVMPGLNVIGGVADEKQFIQALDTLYRDKQHRGVVAGLGRQLVALPEFRWQHVGEAWVEVLERVVHVSEGWTSLGRAEEAVNQ